MLREYRWNMISIAQSQKWFVYATYDIDPSEALRAKWLHGKAANSSLHSLCSFEWLFLNMHTLFDKKFFFDSIAN